MGKHPIITIICRNNEHGEMDYMGNGYFVCPVCGADHQDWEYCDDDEALSVYDAALIWASHGKDEDYMFGYTEEELEDAL